MEDHAADHILIGNGTNAIRRNAGGVDPFKLESLFPRIIQSNAFDERTEKGVIADNDFACFEMSESTWIPPDDHIIT